MDITITEQGERLVVALIGELDNTASRDAEKAMQPVMTQTEHDVLVDCADLNYISSSGLRLLLNLYKHQMDIGKRALLSHLNSYTHEVFLMGGFLTIFEVEE